MRVLFLEPYYGTSHRHLMDGLIRRGDFEAELLAMPPRKWKWRMRGGAWHLARKASQLEPADVIFASDFLDLPAFLALGPEWARDCRLVIYFHENQLTYPVRKDDERDFHFGLTNIETALAADAVAFNSEFHRGEFCAAAGDLISRFPDFRPTGIPEAIEAKSTVIPVPLNLSEIPKSVENDGPLTLVWNMRWEFDKNPGDFFEALFSLADSGMDFRLIVAGERFSDYPPIFDRARERLSGKIISWGFVESRAEYLKLLSRSDLVVSTAIHEFFGIAVAEAVAAGCVPLLPNRLAYPEQYAAKFLYDSREELISRLREMMLDPESVRRLDPPTVADLDWSVQMPSYTRLISPR